VSDAENRCPCCGILFRRDPSRDEEIKERLNAGDRLADIAKDFDLSAERVRQIAHAAGIMWPRQSDVIRRNAAERRENIEQKRKAKKEERAAQLLMARNLVEGGVSIAEAGRIVGLSKGVMQYAAYGWPSQHGPWKNGKRKRSKNTTFVTSNHVSVRTGVTKEDDGLHRPIRNPPISGPAVWALERRKEIPGRKFDVTRSSCGCVYCDLGLPLDDHATKCTRGESQ
jgi:hypothetical protein